MRYDASKAPDPQEWLELDESDRIDLVKRYHIRAKLPVGENERLHAAAHVIVENPVVGIKLSAGGVVVMSDFAKAKNPYIHHSRVPVAVVAMALASPTFPWAFSEAAPDRRGGEGARDG